MKLKLAIAVAGLLAAAPALGQTPDATARANETNKNILAKFYPPRALAAGEEGQVDFQIKIDADGDPMECKILHSSGHPLLDEETCQIIMLHAVFRLKEKSVESRSQLSTRVGTISWSLPEGKAAVAERQTQEANKATKLADAIPPERVVCKRTLKTGDLYGYERVCMTPTEWRRATQEARDFWEETRNKGFSR